MSSMSESEMDSATRVPLEYRLLMLVEAMTSGREVDRASRVVDPPAGDAEADRHRGSEMFLESLAGLLDLVAESRLPWSLVDISSSEWEPSRDLDEGFRRWWWWCFRFWHLHLTQEEQQDSLVWF